MSDIPKLSYAPALPIYRRRVFRWWMIALVLLAVVVSGTWWAPLAWERGELMYWQHECMIYTPAVGAVVYDSTNKGDYVPQPWSRFYGLFSPPGPVSSTILFMHEMKMPNGQTRLVVADLRGFDEEGFGVLIRVLTPGSMSTPPVERPYQFHRSWYTKRVPGSFKITAGMIDPKDSTHFTIPTWHNGTETIYQGWLQNNGNVDFGPTTPSPFE